MMRGMRTRLRSYLTGRNAPVTAALLAIAAVAMTSLTASTTAAQVAYYVVTGR